MNNFELELDIFDIGMIFGPVLAYIPQILTIKKENSIGNFSLWICAILIFSNILRIFFWFGEKYKIALLIQSILMIICQLYLLNECLKASKQNKRSMYHKQDHNSLLIPQNFWKWDDPKKYFESIIYFLIITALFTLTLGGNKLIIQMTGFLSLMIESMLPIPQFLKNYESKSTFGLSVTLIMCWIMGDSFKTCYYITFSQPIQFIICGVIQLFFDSLIIIQLIKYDNKRSSSLI